MLRGMLIHVGVKMRTAPRFIKPCRANDDQFLTLTEALRVYRGRAAHHAHRRELRHRIRDCHQVRNGPKRLGGEGRVEPSHDDALPQRNEFDSKRNDGSIEELHLVDADDFDRIQLRIESLAKVLDGSNRGRLMSLSAMTGDGRPVIPEVNVRFEARDALASNTGTLETAYQFLALSRKHWAGNDFEDARSTVR